jgi:hypothetical protein
MVLNLLACYKKEFLDYLLQMNYSLRSAWRSVGEHHQAKGTKEVYDPLNKGKHYKEIKFPPYILVEECLSSLPLYLKSVEWSRKGQSLYRSQASCMRIEGLSHFG